MPHGADFSVMIGEQHKGGGRMEDNQIIDLYFCRSEEAIAQTDQKYGRYCYSIAYNILTNREDAEESVSDTYLAAWKAMPPRKPTVLSTFLGRITRNLSIDRWRSREARKRGGGELPLALHELEECVAGGNNPEEICQARQLTALYNQFLESLPETQRQVFLCRYWYLYSTAAIAAATGFSDTKVRTMLMRTRKKLRAYLEKEGIL